MIRSWLACLLLAALASSSAAQEAQQTVQETQGEIEAQPVERSFTVMVEKAQGEAERLGAQGDLPAAERALKSAQSQCPGGEEGRPCRQVLDYSLGYLLETGSAVNEARETELLRRAAEFYERILIETPSHPPTLDNLISIYGRLGESERAIPPLERALAADPAIAGRYALQLGDICLRTGRMDDARRLYRRAADLTAHDETPAQRLVQTYKSSSLAYVGELISLGGEWEERFPSAARQAYETAIRLSYRQDPSTADDALSRWAKLLARGGSIGLEDLESLPKDWGSPYVRNLRGYLQDPEHHRWEDLPEYGDGRPTPLPIGAIAVVLGRRKLGAGDLRRAEAIWAEAAAIDADLNLQTELASLYSAHPELDPGGRKFLRTEVEMFDGKEWAYGVGDLKAIQRYHTALGLLYAERGDWPQRGPARGAVFQLEQALFVADERRSAEGFYQPLPRLRERLGEGYLHIGEPGQAVHTYLDAARAYLDIDDLEGASRMLQATDQAAGSPGVQAGADRWVVGEILALRHALAQAAAEEAPPSPELLQRVDSLRMPRTDDIPPPAGGLGARQRFKMLADASLLTARDGNSSGRALRYAGAALKLVLEDGTPLVGTGDLVRLGRLQALVAGTLGVPTSEPEVVAKPSWEEHNLLLPLTLSAEAPTRVRVRPEVVTAARIVTGLGEELISQTALRIRIDQGTITILEVREGTDLGRLVRKMENSLALGAVLLSDRLRGHA